MSMTEATAILRPRRRFLQRTTVLSSAKRREQRQKRDRGWSRMWPRANETRLEDRLAGGRRQLWESGWDRLHRSDRFSIFTFILVIRSL